MRDTATQSPLPRVGPFLYLPVEVAARELDSKLLIAHFAAAVGLETIIGQTWLMQKNITRMPPGIMLFKTLTTRDAKAMRRAHAIGHRMAAIDEEVPGVFPQKSSLRWTSEQAVEACDVIFALGEDHREALTTRFPRHAAKYQPVGNPRWDLLRPEFVGFYDDEIAKIRQEHGRFILVNSNSGFVNSGKGSAEDVVRTLERGGKFDRRLPADAELFTQICQLEQGTIDGAKALLPRLSQAFPEHGIIMRPHPGENMNTWSAIIADVPRAKLVRSGPAVPWILASDVLIHTYCATGVEAFALGKPAFSYRPIDVPALERFQSPRVNPIVESVDELISRVAQVLTDGGTGFRYPPEFRARFERSFTGMTGPFAADRIVRALLETFAVKPKADAACAEWRPGRGYSYSTRTTAHKDKLMPQFEAADISERLERLARQIGRRQTLKVETCGDRTFHIHGHSTIAYKGGRVAHSSWVLEWVRRLTDEVGGP